GEDAAIHKLLVYSHLPDFACNLENFRKQNQLQYDLVFSHYWLSGLVGTYLQGWWNVPHVIMFHTLGAIKNAIGVGEDEPELRIKAEKDLVGKCHHIIASTEMEKTELTRLYGAPPERIGIVPCGVNLDLFRPIDKDTAKKHVGITDDKVIIFVGRIEPLKGLELLLRAMTYLRNGRKPRLIIIGGDENSNNEMGRLASLSRKLDITDSVIFKGMIKHENLPYFYSAAHVCAIPSYYESFGLVALESMACGTPVVATDVGDLNSIINPGESGYIVTDDTPRDLADKIALILTLSNPDMKSALQIRESITHFSWSNISQRIIGEFCELLALYSSR
ncbi:glycosyltransferase, partial [Chloroflexota bacterium]